MSNEEKVQPLSEERKDDNVRESVKWFQLHFRMHT